MPNVLGVLLDGPVTGKLTHTCYVSKRHSTPLLLVLDKLISSTMHSMTTCNGRQCGVHYMYGVQNMQ